MKRRVHFDCRKITRIEFEPVGLRQLLRIEDSAPVREAPGAGAQSYFLLVEEVQNGIEKVFGFASRKSCDSMKRNPAENLTGWIS